MLPGWLTLHWLAVHTSPVLKRQRRNVDAANLVARGFEARQQLRDGLPEARTVVQLLKMRQLMRDDVIDQRQREVNQPPAESDATIVRA